MHHEAAFLTSVFDWTLSNSWRAALLAVAVLAVQLLLRKKLAPRWQYALWFLVVARLVMPIGFESAWSMFNWIPGASVEARGAGYLEPAHAAQNTRAPNATYWHGSRSSNMARGGAAGAGSRYPFAPPSPAMTFNASAPAVKAPVTRDESLYRVDWARLRELLPIFWVCGALLFTLIMLGISFRLVRAVRRQRAVTEAPPLKTLEACKKLMGITTPVALVATNLPGGPALFGYVRPRLLVPESMLAEFDEARLRHVFLHELAHLKRHDILANWVVAALLVLHWFNPALWLAFYRMRADRELACDALALSYLEDDEAKTYGHTILGLFDTGKRAPVVPGAVGILENKANLKRRIAMIATFTKPSRRWTVIAVGLLLGLGVMGLTDARTSAQTTSTGTTTVNKPAAETVPTTKTPIMAFTETPTGLTVTVHKQEPGSAPVAKPEAISPNIKQNVADHPLRVGQRIVIVRSAAVPASANPVKPNTKARANTAIEKELEQPVSVDFKDMRLKDALDYLAGTYGITIARDPRAIVPWPKGSKREHVSPQALPEFREFTGNVVTDGIVHRLKLDNVPLKSALEALLRPLHLDYTISPGLIFISSPQLLKAEGLKAEIGTKAWQPSRKGVVVLRLKRKRGRATVSKYGGAFGGRVTVSKYGGAFGRGGAGGYGAYFGGGAYGGSQRGDLWVYEQLQKAGKPTPDLVLTPEIHRALPKQEYTPQPPSPSLDLDDGSLTKGVPWLGQGARNTNVTFQDQDGKPALIFSNMVVVELKNAKQLSADKLADLLLGNKAKPYETVDIETMAGKSYGFMTHEGNGGILRVNNTDVKQAQAVGITYELLQLPENESIDARLVAKPGTFSAPGRPGLPVIMGRASGTALPQQERTAPLSKVEPTVATSEVYAGQATTTTSAVKPAAKPVTPIPPPALVPTAKTQPAAVPPPVEAPN